MNKTILYSIIVLVILVIVVLGWTYFSVTGAFKGGIPGKPPNGNGGGGGKFDFSLSANPSSGTVAQGDTTTSTVTVNLVKGKTKTVELFTVGCSPHFACTLNPEIGKPTFSSTLTIETSDTTPTGSHVITIKGAGRGKTKSITYTLTVNPLPCTCGSWTNVGCGQDGCPANLTYQTRTCTPAGCDVESQCAVDSSCITNNTATKEYRVLFNATGYIGNNTTSGLFIIVTPTTPLFTGFYESSLLSVGSKKTLQDNTILGLINIDTSGITNTANIFLESTVDYKEDTLYQHQEKTISLEVLI